MVEGGHFRSKTAVGHGIGHMDATLGVGRVVCMKHRDFGKTNRNANYLSAVIISTFVLLTPNSVTEGILGAVQDVHDSLTPPLTG